MFGLPIEVIVGLITLVMGAYTEHKKQQIEDEHNLKLALADASERSANEANKRGGAGLRMAVALIIIIVAFGGLLVVGLMGDIPVTQFVEREPWLNLLGLLKLGGGTQTLEATGFVIPDYMRFSVISIVHFLFGMAAAKR